MAYDDKMTEVSNEYYGRFRRENLSPENSASSPEYKYTYNFRFDELLDNLDNLQDLQMDSQNKKRFVIKHGQKVLKTKNSEKKYTLQSASDNLRLIAERSSPPNYLLYNIATNEQISLNELQSFLKNKKNVHVSKSTREKGLDKIEQIILQNQKPEVKTPSPKIKDLQQKKSVEGTQLKMDFGNGINHYERAYDVMNGKIQSRKKATRQRAVKLELE